MGSLTSPNGHVPSTLLLDADDTLWENNIYFEQAVAEFLTVLKHSRLSNAEVLAALDAVGLANRATSGYGALSFSRNLCECFTQLCEHVYTAEELRQVQLLGERILSQELELIADVAETVAYLAERYRLVMFTMGQPDEQQRKVTRSGLAEHFARVVVAPEKTTAAYRQLIDELCCEPVATWMIGNSPRSDINPALEAGLNAVFIPHPHTWHLQQQPLRDGPGRLLVLQRFRELREHF